MVYVIAYDAAREAQRSAHSRDTLIREKAAAWTRQKQTCTLFVQLVRTIDRNGNKEFLGVSSALAAELDIGNADSLNLSLPGLVEGRYIAISDVSPSTTVSELRAKLGATPAFQAAFLGLEKRLRERNQEDYIQSFSTVEDVVLSSNGVYLAGDEKPLGSFDVLYPESVMLARFELEEKRKRKYSCSAQ